MLAFLFRETREGAGHHPQFERYLENAIVQGQFDPGTLHYGPHNVEIGVTFEKVHPETINIESISERIEKGGIDSLTEAEMREFLKTLSRSEHLDTNEVQQEFKEWVDEFEEQYPYSPNRITEILAHVDGRDPFEVRTGLESEEANDSD